MGSVFYIDLSEVMTKEELQDILVKELPLPDYYGKNLDALNDVLTESGNGWNIIFYNTKFAAVKLGKYFDALKRLCKEAAEDMPELKIRFFE
ncbi:barnase inhibitor [Butyrivibrio sp. X503]|uniref:barstar family protein n=1 Tax=Butyrivibrio sp. X503 TaxID=2364878 RepID=UPI000EA960BC|nr:barstar family protein [Butyrivibrio sp. X503]RKM58302.1 barnase inhibitor [Butyrivibrio sp. X503]